MAAPYIEWELLQGNVRTAMAVASLILGRNPNDPVGLWYAGRAMLATQDPGLRAEAQSLMRRGLKNGLERRLPISNDVIQGLGGG
jgi:hypothetical protein